MVANVSSERSMTQVSKLGLVIICGRYSSRSLQSRLVIVYMAQAHETGTSQVGGPKLAKVF